MEDPWGSPWATTEHESNGQHNPTDTKPEPPPPAFFSTTPNNLSIPSSQSAWLEDDSFGDWASPEALQPAAPSWGAWGTSDTAPGDGGQLTPRYESKRKTSIPKWPTSRSTSPGHRTGPLSKRPSSDHLSLDPWASEYSSHDRDREPGAPLTEIQHLPPLPTAGDFDGNPTTLRSRASDISITLEAPRPVLALSRGGATADEIPVTECSTPPELRIQPVASPTTSTSDGDGPRDATREDSPITPVEDGQASTAAERKASKVHQLVEMFDGIARKTSVPMELVPPPKRSSSQSPASLEASLTGESETSDSTGGGKLSSMVHSETTVALCSADLTDGAGPAFTTTPEANYSGGPLLEEQTGVHTSEDENEDSVIVTPKFTDHDPFHVDLGQLNTLFTFPASKVTGTDVEVPDRIITDSFESVSERRMWYRLSRYESLRRYDAGNDDDYIRITWTSSTVRSDAMKTVRRWMEEDSIGRRPFRTGLAKGVGGHGFGWDKAGTQVDLEKFFGRKRPDQSVTTAPTPRSSMSGLPPNVAVITNDPRPMSLPPPAASANNWTGPASFGWSSGANDVQTGNDQPSLSKGISPDDWVPLKDGAATQQKTTASKPFKTPSSLAIQTSRPPANDEDDDEWGDMVTPSIDEFPRAAQPPEHVQPAPLGQTWSLDGLEDDASKKDPTQQPYRHAVSPTERTGSPEAQASTPSPPLTEAAEDAVIVEQFLRSLPDLSYMLR